MPNVLSPRALVSRPDNMDETVLHVKHQIVNPSPVADPEGVQGVCANCFLRPNYFNFMGIFTKSM